MKKRFKNIGHILLCSVIISAILLSGMELSNLSLVTKADSTNLVEFTKCKYRSLSGDSHISVKKVGEDEVLTFSRNYAAANTWSGGGIQLRTDDGEYYKLKPSTSYQVKFDYRVESYSEASDAEFKDLSLMVAVSKNDEGTFTNARSVTSRDLDAVTFAHKANEPATKGDYAAVGARIKAEEVDNNWHSVTAVFTTKETLELPSGTYDNLTLSIISNKTNAGDIKVSFKNIFAEKLNLSISFNELKHHSLSGDDYLSVVQEGTDKILTFNRNYTDEEANELWAGDGIQLKTDNNEFYKLKPLSTYRIKFDYRVESYNEADDAQFKDLSLMVAVSKNDEDFFTNARSVTARDLDAVTFAHKANEPATSGDYAAVGAKIKAGEVDSAWHSVTAEFTTKETLTTGSGTYDNLTLSIISNKIKAGNMKISFKKISVEVLNEPEPDIEPTHDPIYFFNAITAGAVKYKYGATEQEDYIELSKNSSDNAMAFQYKTDKDTFYKVKQYIGYRVSFSYRVPDYTEYRNNGKMYITIGGTMNGETAWWETRNIISNDRGQMSVSIKDGKKYPGIEVSGHINDWKQANVTFDIYNSIANIKDPNKVYENLTFLILSGDPNGSGRSKTTVQIKDIKISQVELDNGERTIEFVTNGGKKVDPMNVNVMDFENMVLPTTTRDKFIFTGWYFDELCTKPFNIDDCVADATGRIVLYAGWKALETGLNFQFTTVKKAQTIYETVSDDTYSNSKEDDNKGSGTTKVIKKRKKLIRTINGDSDGFSVAKVIVLISVIAVFVIAGGLTLFFVIKKKKFRIGK